MRTEMFISLVASLCIHLVACGSAAPTTHTAPQAGHGSAPPADPPSTPDEEKLPTIKVKLPAREGEPIEFTLEIAADDHSRAIGLSGRKEVAEHGGMIFAYPRAAHRGFWMWNCLIDIDVIYFDPKGMVTATHAMKKELPRQPGESITHYEDRLPRYRSRRPAQFAIELRAGWLEKLDLEPGDVVEFDREKLEELAKRAEER
jgi:uncharacterized membrane protein (UPF0127 family)